MKFASRDSFSSGDAGLLFYDLESGAVADCPWRWWVGTWSGLFGSARWRWLWLMLAGRRPASGGSLDAPSPAPPERDEGISEDMEELSPQELKIQLELNERVSVSRHTSTSENIYSYQLTSSGDKTGAEIIQNNGH